MQFLFFFFSEGEEYDLVMEEFKRVAVKGFEEEISGGLTSLGI